MTIARMQYSGVGARIYTPEGPYGSLGSPPFASYRPGEVVDGDCESMFVFLALTVLTPQILNQGDLLFWDGSFRAAPAVTGAGAFAVGMKAGTLFLGGAVGDEQLSTPVPPVNAFQANFTLAGVYGVWAQRFGSSLIKAAAGAASGSALSTTAVAGQVNSGAGAVGSYTVGPAFVNPASVTFTANTTAGSALLLNASSNFGVSPGMAATGTGVPAGTYVKDVNGPTITLSQAATATATAVSISAAQRSAVGNTTTGSNLVTGVSSLAGVYPNCTIAGTGIPAATTIIAITGSPGAYTVVLSAAATATGSAVALTASGYVEANLADPYITTAN
jgi:hypothetical protein